MPNVVLNGAEKQLIVSPGPRKGLPDALVLNWVAN